MNKEHLFAFLEDQDSPTLLRFLGAAYEAMESGQEIVFADECGDWMISGDPKPTIAAYLTSLAAAATPEEYAAAAIPFIREDSLRSSSHKTYDTAIRAANKAQKAHLKSEVQRLKIPTKPRSRT